MPPVTTTQLSLEHTRTLVVAAAGLAYVANVAPFLHIKDAQAHLARAGWKRFLWINYVTGAVVTITCVAAIAL